MCKLAPNVYGSVWNKLRVTPLLPGSLTWLLDFLKNLCTRGVERASTWKYRPKCIANLPSLSANVHHKILICGIKVPYFSIDNARVICAKRSKFVKNEHARYTLGMKKGKNLERLITATSQARF